jgi:trk system potassium uptake protein TrkA
MANILCGSAMLCHYLGRTLVARGLAVTVINPDRAECEWLAGRLKATVVCGDATDPEILDDAGAGRAQLLAALTGHDPDNLVMCQLARQRFGVGRTLALVNDPAKAEVFTRLGITETISLTATAAAMIERQVGFDEILSQLPLAGGGVVVSEVKLEAAAPAVDREVAELGLPAGSLVGCVIRAGVTTVVRGGFRFAAGDRVLLLAVPEDIGPALRRLTGEEA